MADFPVDRPWELVISGADERRLMQHLFPGDGDEHGATIIAGLHVLADRVRLLIRHVALAEDGIDYVPGHRGYRMLKAQFVRGHLMRARDERVAYLSVHNHGGTNRVEFSSDDLASHERGYPALLDIVKGMPVGALVFARGAIAGDIWLPNGLRVALRRATVVDGCRSVLYPAPPLNSRLEHRTEFDRQVRLFGAAGQTILHDATVGIVGLGGAGSILAELLGRLGVGRFVLIDPERGDLSNLPRLLGARRSDVLVSEAWSARFGALSKSLNFLRRRKVDLAARNIRRANRRASIRRVAASLAEPHAARELLGCDFIFLAADQMIARLVFNAIVHQYLIPGVQIGARVVTDDSSGSVSDVFAVSRPVTPNQGCLWCNSLIDATRLQLEATAAAQVAAQHYGTESPAPSVVTLNALAAADAANSFMFYITGLSEKHADQAYMRFRPRLRSIVFDEPRKSERCTECGRINGSRYGLGDAGSLPTH